MKDEVLIKTALFEEAAKTLCEWLAARPDNREDPTWP